MRKWKYIVSFFLVVTMLLGAGISVSASDTITKVEKSDSGLYEIMGPSSVTIGQMVNYFQNNTLGVTYPSFYATTEAPTIYAFAQIYMEECQAEGVKAEVAFAQCMHETGYLTYPGDATPDQFNFAGLDTWGQQPDGTVVKGRSYPSLRIGIRAHVQRLKAWAVKGTTPSSFRNPCVDVNKFQDNWWMRTCVGSAPYVQYLEKENNPSGYGWATDTQYTEKIMRHLNLCLSASRYTTWYKGVDYSAVFSPDYYLGHYADIARAYSGREEDAIEHFIIFGMNEGRQGCASFDVKSYRRQYADLRLAFGNDLKSYYLHYMGYGVQERRKGTGCTSIQNGITKLNGIDYSAVYNFDYYKSTYSDINRIFGDDDIAALNHFISYGMREGRQAISSFNVVSYLNRYPDLRRAFGRNMVSYYKHFIDYGIRENRAGTGCDIMQGAQTVYNGVNYSAIYDYNYYISRYPDVARAFGGDENLTLQHFVDYGMNEGRQGSVEFNVQFYASQYGDLQNAFGSNLKAYYLHYLNYGLNEGRTGK